MNKLHIFVAIAALLGTTRIAGAATAIGFEDLPFPGGNPLAAQSLTGTYQNLVWSGSGGNGGAGWVISPNDATGWYGGTRQPYSHSGNNFAWNSGGSDLAITAQGGGSFDLESFWVRSWPSASFSVTAHGYRNGTEIYTLPFSTTDLYIKISPNIIGISQFTITLAAPRSLLFDDFTIANISAVPEANSAATITLGLLALGAFFRKCKKRPQISASNREA